MHAYLKTPEEYIKKLVRCQYVKESGTFSRTVALDIPIRERAKMQDLAL